MNIIQSFWTKPIFNGLPYQKNSRFCGGWLDTKYHLMSWALSCLQLRSFYKDVELVTDAVGKSILIDFLELPYSNVSVELENMPSVNMELWALGKIHTLSLQKKPFLHVDSDVFIWAPFPNSLETAALLAQNIEHNFSFYKTVLDQLEKEQSYIPDIILANRLTATTIDAYNAGIIGGNDLEFFSEFVAEAWRFATSVNTGSIALKSGMFNSIYEQHLYYCMAKGKRLEVTCLTDITDKAFLNSFFKDIERFDRAPFQVKYIHLFGEDAKKNFTICEILDRKLKTYYPKYYERINQFTATL